MHKAAPGHAGTGIHAHMPGMQGDLRVRFRTYYGITRLLIIVPAKNEEALLPHVLSSIVLNLRDLPESVVARVVVVDDASTDRTPQVAKRFAREHGFVEYVRLSVAREYDPGAGLVRAVKAGLLYAERVLGFRWDYFMQVDADTVLLPGYISKVLHVMLRSNDIGIAGGVTINESQARFHIRNTGMIIRRRVWDDCRGYRPSPSPDTILCLCAISKGWRIAVVKSATMYLLRPTRFDAYTTGFSDGIIGTSVLFAVLRLLRLFVHGCVSTEKYFAGYIAGRRCPLKDKHLIAKARRMMEKLRIRDIVSSMF